MVQTLRIAIAGAGMVTRHHLLGWRKQPGVEIVGISNRTRSRAEERAREFAIPRVFEDYETMLDELRPDAVDIASATETHGPYCSAAAARGIHLFCQKPLTGTLAEAEALIAGVGERVRFMVHENWRFRPQYRLIQQWVRDGRVGPVREFRFATRSSGFVTRGRGGRPFALERQPFFSDMPRFLILEVLIHHLDTLRSLIGPVEVVAAQTARVSPDLIGEDVAQIALKAASGAFGTVVGNLSAAGEPPLPSDRLELAGEKASVLFEDNVVTLKGETEERVELDLAAAYQASYDNAIAHFAGCLRSDTPFETDRLDNLETLRLVDRAYALAGQ
jgi:predicted dehydrogenase